MHDGCKGEGEEEHRAERNVVQTQCLLGVQQPPTTVKRCMKCVCMSVEALGIIMNCKDYFPGVVCNAASPVVVTSQ